MKLSLAIGGIAGLALALALAGYYGFAEIADGIGAAGWGVLAVIAFHPLQVLFSALAWQSLVPPPPPSRAITFIGLRWIREAVNNLLPVAQIGGEFVGARLLRRGGVPLSVAGASVTVDLTMEMVSQIVFTLLGLALLVPGLHEPRVALWTITGIGLAVAIIVVFIGAQRFGMFHLIERSLIELAERGSTWAALGDIAGLHRSIEALYASPARLVRACGHHFISWLLGGLEVMLALHLVGVSVGWREGLIIESLGQALRAVGFAIPASLGVQEGGYVLICGLLGISPQAAIELSLLKRIREVALGIPALVTWQIIESRRLVGPISDAGVAATADGD
ncbi:MAG TPA: lysylphosphatidylglycerol synthase domain-containing protein [Stellaceae bacterium]|nr:lysylphosphatidylglycerol synthase domain-containing protein [Stellaceae bacterium]